MEYTFPAVVVKEGKFFVATCPEPEVTSQGETIEEALDNLKEAIELYLEDEDAKIPNTCESPIVTTVRV